MLLTTAKSTCPRCTRSSSRALRSARRRSASFPRAASCCAPRARTASRSWGSCSRSTRPTSRTLCSRTCSSRTTSSLLCLSTCEIINVIQSSFFLVRPNLIFNVSSEFFGFFVYWFFDVLSGETVCECTLDCFADKFYGFWQFYYL